MLFISSSSLGQLRQLNQQIRDALKPARSFEEAAQTTTDMLFGAFSSSLALVRLYVTVPYSQLPDSLRRFVQQWAEGRAPSFSLGTHTQVLTLLGSRGMHSDWNDRHRSKSHKGIPLLNSSFVGGIPMLARLLKELGADINWLDTQKGFLGKSFGANLASLFYVEDAATAKDEFGRLVIPAQDFVSACQIKTVFGVGGGYFNGQILALIFFCRESLSKQQAEQFMILAVLLKAATASLLSKLFH